MNDNVIVTFRMYYEIGDSSLRNLFIQIPEPQYIGADPLGKGSHFPLLFAPQTRVILGSADFLGMISGLNFPFPTSQDVTGG
jgi:hypothetical protein